MSGLRRHVFHECQKPTLPDAFVDYLWTCDDCRSEWWWNKDMRRERTHIERFGFLGCHKRIVKTSVGIGLGFWIATKRTSTWEDVK